MAFIKEHILRFFTKLSEILILENDDKDWVLVYVKTYKMKCKIYQQSTQDKLSEYQKSCKSDYIQMKNFVQTKIKILYAFI